MTFNTDHFQVTGHGHVEIGCQDYAISGNKGRYAYAIICDGCSGSKDSDVGAKLIATVARYWIDISVTPSLDWVLENPTVIAESSLNYILNQKELSDHLTPGSLDSTLLIAIVTPLKYVVIMHGDGHVAERTGDGLNITSVEYPSGYPYYPSYLVNEQSHAVYEKTLSQTTREVTTESYPISGLDRINTRSHDVYSPTIIAGNSEGLRTLILTSDGIGSFNERGTQKKLSYSELRSQIFDIKNTKEMFVKRKLLALERSKGLYHHDDLSMAAINITN